MNRFRSALVALVALALSAGAVLAGRNLPSTATTGLDVAAQAAGNVVPVRAGQGATPGAPAPPVAAEEEGEADLDHSAHGKLVSAAAHGPTPLVGGFENHGQYVSSIARQNHGQAVSADAQASGAKPESAGKPAGAGKPEGVGKPEGAGNPND